MNILIGIVIAGIILKFVLDGKGSKRSQSLYLDGDNVVLFTPNSHIDASRSSVGGFDLRSVSYEYRYPMDSVKIVHRFNILTVTGSGERTVYRSANPLKKGNPRSQNKFENLSLSFEINHIDVSDDIRALVIE